MKLDEPEDIVKAERSLEEVLGCDDCWGGGGERERPVARKIFVGWFDNGRITSFCNFKVA